MSAASIIAPISGRRRRKDKVARGMLLTATLIALVPLVLVIYYLLKRGLGDRMNSMPIQIFNDVGQAQDRLVQRAWGAALTLVVLVLILTLLARLIQRRSKLAA